MFFVNNSGWEFDKLKKKKKKKIPLKNALLTPKRYWLIKKSLLFIAAGRCCSQNSFSYHAVLSCVKDNFKIPQMQMICRYVRK